MLRVFLLLSFVSTSNFGHELSKKKFYTFYLFFYALVSRNFSHYVDDILLRNISVTSFTKASFIEESILDSGTLFLLNWSGLNLDLS